MFGASTFGSEAFGAVRIDVVGAAPPGPPSVPLVVASLVGRVASFSLVGRIAAVSITGRAPATIVLPSMRGPT